MLRTSTKNIAYEVISCLIESNGKGGLTEIIKWFSMNQKIFNYNESILDMLKRKKDVDDSEGEEPESFARATLSKGTAGGATDIASTTSASSNN